MPERETENVVDSEISSPFLFLDRGSPPQLYCWSYPGVNLNLAATTSEQMISLATGPQGCLDGTMHSILKYLAIAMGKRNEHQRGDRNSSITMQESNLAVPVSYISCRAWFFQRSDIAYFQGCVRPLRCGKGLLETFRLRLLLDHS